MPVASRSAYSRALALSRLTCTDSRRAWAFSPLTLARERSSASESCTTLSKSSSRCAVAVFTSDSCAMVASGGRGGDGKDNSLRGGLFRLTVLKRLEHRKRPEKPDKANHVFVARLTTVT